MRLTNLGIIFNGLHSFDDLGLWITQKIVEHAPAQRIYKTVAYMDSSYDFTKLYGRPSRPDRKITIVFRISENSKMDMENKIRRVMAWLNTSERLPMYDDAIWNCHYLAEVTNVSEPDEQAGRVSITVEFTAYPYLIGNYQEGKLLWDDVCFETDYFIETVFNVNYTTNIEVYNQSAHEIVPTVICSAPMAIRKGGINYVFLAGENYNEDFELSPGNNELMVVGAVNATVEFAFYKEVL